jgi:hypothetical protein
LFGYRLPRLSASPTILPMHHVNIGFPSWCWLLARIAASDSGRAGLCVAPGLRRRPTSEVPAPPSIAHQQHCDKRDRLAARP